LKFVYQHNGSTYTVNLEQRPDGYYHATIIDGTGKSREYTFEAHSLPHGWQLIMDQARVRVYSAAQGNKRFAQVDGTPYEFTIPDERSTYRRSKGGEHAASLAAQMPGQVRTLLVEEGAIVTRGQTLVVLEAMKMEIRIAAPSDGTISRVYVQQGDVVERGQVLVEID
jgi:biotin carboxyl carrier protein